MIERLSRNKRNLVLALLGLLVVWFAWSIRSVVNPLLVGYLLAFILHPLVERVQLLGFSRRTAVNLVFLTGFLLAVGISIGLFLQTSSLVQELLPTEEVALPAAEAQAPTASAEGESVAPLELWLSALETRLGTFTDRVNGWFGTELDAPLVPDVQHIQAWATRWVDKNKDEGLSLGFWLLTQSAALTTEFVGGVLALGGMLFLVPLYCYYLLFELERLHRFVVRYIPKTDRQRLSGVGREIGEVIAAFFRGRLSVCLFKGLILAFGLWVAGVDYALLFGILSGFLSLVPFVGAAIGFLIAFVFATVEHGVLGSVLRTGVVYFAAEMIEGYVLVPRILGDSLGLHPLVVIFAIFAGGAALGTLGIVAALPLTAALVILVRELVLPAMQRLADEDPRPRAADPPAPAAES